MQSLKSLVIASILAGLAATTAQAEVKPHPIFSDNMVLQREMPLPVWGKADPGEQVTVTLELQGGNAASSSTATAMADKVGNWSVKFPPQKAGTGYQLQVKGKDKSIDYKNVAVGEVWICSGQSNMQWEMWRLTKDEQGKKVSAEATNPNLRFLTLARRPAATPQYDFPVRTEPRGKDGAKAVYGQWQVCDPESTLEFSAVGYYFGQDLEKALKVPVGLIATNWGGTVCEAWTSLEALDAEPNLKYLADRARAAAKQHEMDKRPPNQNSPTALYNGMIHPLLNFPVRGAIWYQGESNAGRAHEYRTLYPTMIKDWRKRWDTELPFIGVQLAPFGNGKNNSNGVTYAELRDAQLLATKVLPKVGVAVITDAGDEVDIHPQQKRPVGERLALSARALAYGEKVTFNGPQYKTAAFNGPMATITFDSIGGGLMAKDGDLTGFAAAGADGVFHPAKAVINGDQVVVTSDKVEKVTAVRFGWVNFAKPTLNLFNKAGLPASPFRTDDLPLTTMPKSKK